MNDLESMQITWQRTIKLDGLGLLSRDRRAEVAA
jgi:hypothetical protein